MEGETVHPLPYFTALSLNILNLEPCDLDRTGHRPKMFLYMLDELMYAY